MTLALSGPLVETVFGTPVERCRARCSPSSSLYGVLYAFSLLFANVLVATGKTVRLLLIQLAWVSTLVPAMIVSVNYWGPQRGGRAHVVTILLVGLPGYVMAVLRVTISASGACPRRPSHRPSPPPWRVGPRGWLLRPFDASWLRLVSAGWSGVSSIWWGLGPSPSARARPPRARLASREVPRPVARSGAGMTVASKRRSSRHRSGGTGSGRLPHQRAGFGPHPPRAWTFGERLRNR